MKFVPQLIVFLEIDPSPIVQLIENIEPICNLEYPYEYHLTLGWFTDENPAVLRNWGNKTLSFINGLIGQFKAGSFKIIMTGAGRQTIGRGGGFYLKPSIQTAQQLNEIHKSLSSFMHQNKVRTSEMISVYNPHVSLTNPITQATIEENQELAILKTLNDKIASIPGMLVLQPTAIRAILKYADLHGNEQKEIWKIKNSAIKIAINS